MLTQTINAILQGLGNNKIPVFASIIGIFFKLFSNIYLMQIDWIAEKGAIIGNILSSFISFIIVYCSLKNRIILNFKILRLSIKPFWGSLIMILISLSLNKIILKNYIKGNVLGLISIVISVIIYVFFLYIHFYLEVISLFRKKKLLQ